MLFDLLQVATDLGCQMESLLSSVQQHQRQHQAGPAPSAPTRQRASEAASLSGTDRQTISSGGRNRGRAAACKPLDLSFKSSSCEPDELSPELTGTSERLMKLHEEAPLNLVKSDAREQLASCLSSTSPTSSSSSIYGSSHSTTFNSSSSSFPCDRRKANCDNTDNNNNNDAIFDGQHSEQLGHLEELRNSSNEVQISSTNGRQRRRGQKSAKSSKNHLCEHCGRSFSRSDMLTRHSRLHSGLKPYQCAKCLQVFSRSDHLSTHERTHTGEKPYQCRICSYSACRRDMITRHMRTHAVGRLGARSSRRRTRESARKMKQQANDCEDDVSTSAQIGLMES